MAPRTWSRLLLALALLCLAPASVRAQQKAAAPPPAASAPAPDSWDLYVTVFSTGTAPDKLGIAYNDPKVTDATIKEDTLAFARQLGSPEPKLKIERKEDTPTVEAELTGLTNWKTGQVSLDALVSAYRRFRHFRVSCFFFGSFPLASADNILKPPIRVQTQASGNTVHYEIWVDQSGGVPSEIPALQPKRAGGGWQGVVLILAILVILAGCAFLIWYGVMSKRRQPEDAPGNE